jgi:predicted HTH domain antitoxin
MAMAGRLTIEYDEGILLGLGLSPDEFADEARMLIAAKLYELGRLTSGQAARLSGKTRVVFLLALERYGVPMSSLRPEDVEAELAFARDEAAGDVDSQWAAEAERRLEQAERGEVELCSAEDVITDARSRLRR